MPSVFAIQRRLMDSGIDVRLAYQMAVDEYKETLRKKEIEERVAREQRMRAASIPASRVLEDMAMDEKDRMNASIDLAEQMQSEQSNFK